MTAARTVPTPAKILTTSIRRRRLIRSALQLGFLIQVSASYVGKAALVATGDRCKYRLPADVALDELRLTGPQVLRPGHYFPAASFFVDGFLAGAASAFLITSFSLSSIVMTKPRRA